MNDLDTFVALLKMLKEATRDQAAESPPFEVGIAYIIRSATMTNVGKVKELRGGFIIMEDAAWVADTGRFYDALASGNLSEVEPYPHGCFVAIAGIIDAAPWVHSLPLKQK